jgi:hypothetical protein
MNAGIIYLICSAVGSHAMLCQQKSVVNFGRTLQRRFNIPEWLCIFSEAEPGMEDSDLEGFGRFVVRSCCFAVIDIMLLVGDAPVTLLMLICHCIAPACFQMVRWCWFVRSRRRLDEAGASSAEGRGEEDRGLLSEQASTSTNHDQGQVAENREKITEPEPWQGTEWKTGFQIVGDE